MTEDDVLDALGLIRGVVGVDPSIASTGVGWIKNGHMGTQRFQTDPTDSDIYAKLERLRFQRDRVVSVVEFMVPSLIAIEGGSFASSGNVTHDLAGFWWEVVDDLEQLAPIAIVQPGTLKKYVTGNGQADKKWVHKTVHEKYPDLVPKAFTSGNDQADALALACMAADYLGLLYPGGFHDAGINSVEKVNWPENIREGVK